MPRLTALLLLLAVGPAAAGTVYKCSGAHGRVTYQDAPCAKSQQQQTLQLPDDTGAPSPPASAAAEPDPPPAVAARPAPPSAPVVPLIQLYRCRHAVDGSIYVSRNGNPPPFRAPLGMLGAFTMPLADVYGSPGHAGISAPEATRGRVSSGLIANNYVWVKDQCRPLSVPEICHELGDEQEQNARKLRRAFKSDRPPLQQRDDELQAQLTNC
jgi:hypothetical protein